MHLHQCITDVLNYRLFLFYTINLSIYFLNQICRVLIFSRWTYFFCVRLLSFACVKSLHQSHRETLLILWGRYFQMSVLNFKFFECFYIRQLEMIYIWLSFYFFDFRFLVKKKKLLSLSELVRTGFETILIFDYGYRFT